MSKPIKENPAVHGGDIKKPILHHIELREVQDRFKSLGLNQCQITAMLTDPVVAPRFFSGNAVIVVRDCHCCGDKTVFAAWK